MLYVIIKRKVLRKIFLFMTFTVQSSGPQHLEKLVNGMPSLSIEHWLLKPWMIDSIAIEGQTILTEPNTFARTFLLSNGVSLPAK